MDKTRRQQLEAEYDPPDHWNYKSDPYELTKYEQTLALVPPGRYARVLEIGCSEGTFTRRLAGVGDEVIGLDIVPVALERARAECAGLPNIHFREFDLDADTLEGQFDLIFCAEVLYYLRWTRLRPVTRKIVSWLRPGGYLLAVHATSAVAADWGFGPKGAELTHRLLERPGMRRLRDQSADSYVLSVFRKEAEVSLSPVQERLDDLLGTDYPALARAALRRVASQTARWRGRK